MTFQTQRYTPEGKLACQDCGKRIKGNPNGAQCNTCTFVFCSEHRKRDRKAGMTLCLRHYS